MRSMREVALSPDIEFREDRDLINMRLGVYQEELGRRIVYLSPAAFSLMKTDKPLMLENLRVAIDGEVKWIMDIGGGL